MDKFDPLENIIHLEAKTDWLTQELSDYGVSEPSELVKEPDPSKLCFACKNVIEPNVDVVLTPDGTIHLTCAKDYYEVMKKESPNLAYPHVLYPFIKERIPEFNPNTNNEHLKFANFLINEFDKTNKNVQWIEKLISLYPYILKIVVNHLDALNRLEYSKSFGAVTNYNINTAKKYCYSYYIISKALPYPTRKYFCEFPENLFYEIPNIYNKVFQNTAKSSEDFLAVGAKTTDPKGARIAVKNFAEERAKSLIYGLVPYARNAYLTTSEKGKLVDLAYKLIEIGEQHEYNYYYIGNLNNVLIRSHSSIDNLINSKALNTVILLSSYMRSPGAFIKQNSDAADYYDILHKLSKKYHDTLKKFKSNQTYCFKCKYYNTLGYYSCTSCGQPMLSNHEFATKFFNKVIHSRVLPSPDDMKTPESIWKWIFTKNTSYRAITRQNDRRAQKNPRWAVAKFPVEFYRGLRTAPLYEQIMSALSNRLKDYSDDVVIAVHGRDGEMMYELAKALYPELYKRMVYIITSRPLTSERASVPGPKGFSEAAIIKYDDYINRILPKDKPAVHVDTGFAGSIPEWFIANGWDVKDIRLVSAERDAYSLLGSKSMDDNLRDVVLNDLEHTPQRLSKISDISQWGSLKYSKYAPGFWSRLHGIISGINQNKNVECDHSSGRKKCPRCMIIRLKSTARKRTSKIEYKNSTDLMVKLRDRLEGVMSYQEDEDG